MKPDYPQPLPIRERAAWYNRSLKKKLETVLPAAMRENDIDMWLMISQEDNLDLVLQSMLPYETWQKILNIFIFFDRGEAEGIERIALARSRTIDYGTMEDLYYKLWHGKRHVEQWELLPQLIEERDPRRIGINVGSVNWATDGLTHGLYQQMVEVLPQKYIDRLVSAEPAGTRWLMTHTDDEVDLYMNVIGPIAHGIIHELYTSAYITPGKTTCLDLVWAHWQKCLDLGIDPPFKPNYYIRRSDREAEKHGPDDDVIRPGDLVFCDVGVKYMGLHTDMKEWLYVRREGETDVPAGFKHAMAEANRLQDIYMSQPGFEQGLTGNQILSRLMARAREANIPGPRVYSHSCGRFVHEPGSLVGLPWSMENNPGRGDVPMQYNSSYTMELSVDVEIPEWDNQLLRMSLEQDVVFTRDGVQVIDGRQTEFHLL